MPSVESPKDAPPASAENVLTEQIEPPKVVLTDNRLEEE